ncbi:MAG: Gfo/Idh/MocA family oxidoreductase [Christensenella sp.]
MQKKVKIAVIGLGFIGITHLQALKTAKNVVLVAVVDVNEALGKKTAQEYGVLYYSDIESLCHTQAVDIVDICVPTWLHEDCIIYAAKQGKHILCEKPITFTMESYQRMVQAVTAANVKFMVAQVIRFWPEYVRIKELQERGEFGDIRQVAMRRLCETPNWSAWYSDPQKSGGALYDLMLHDLDFAQYFLGEMRCVYATGTQSETGCWNHVLANISFKNGACASVEACNAAFGHFPFAMAMRVFADKMLAEYELHAGHNIDEIGERALYTYTHKAGASKQLIEETDPYTAEIDYFAQCVQQNKACDTVSIASAQNTLRLVLAVKESLETGRVISL